MWGFPCHTAPGEAEAECALLQKANIVDAVMSEDVDAIMFGSSMTMVDWSTRGPGGTSSTPVTLYQVETIRKNTGLESEGMILFALMSGGDYIPAGIPHCGIKPACEAAKAGFGRALSRIPLDDIDGIKRWRDRLKRELHQNESLSFRRRHNALNIPDTFPASAVLDHYRNPVVLSKDQLARLCKEIRWGPIDVPGLRTLVKHFFNWPSLDPKTLVP